MPSTREWKLYFSVKRSSRYHERRRAWFEFWHHLTLFGVVLTTGGVAARIELVETGDSQIVSWSLAVLSGVLVILNIVLRFAEKASEHKALSRRFRDLEIQLALWRKGLPDDEYQRILGLRIEIEKDEPPVLRLLDALCHQELRKALYPDYSDKELEAVREAVPFLRRATAHLFSQPLTAARVPRQAPADG